MRFRDMLRRERVLFLCFFRRGLPVIGGSLSQAPDTVQLTPRRYVIHLPARRHWRGKSRIKDIESGLADPFVTLLEAHKSTAI